MSMSKETTYWSKILELKPIACIYSHESLKDGFSLDHFLPWTFVTHNQLWNLIPVNSSSNSSKSNNLPDLDSYLTKFIETHSTAIRLSREIFSDKKWQKYMEPYISDLHLTSYADVLDEVKLEAAYNNTIRPLYEIAQSNGFCAGWQYSTTKENKYSINRNNKIIDHSIVNVQSIFEQHIVDQIPENKKYVSSLPFYSLEIAAGGFADSEIDEETKQWIDTKRINLIRSLSKDMFISQVHGHSMEPLIPDGSFCLFKYGVSGSRNGRIVLVKKEGYEDLDTKASFTIKKYFSQKTTDNEFEWKHEKIELRPENPEYPVLTIEPDDADNFYVIAEFLQVIE
jgi:SOS-response transcriptional repressor LexA